MDDWEKIADDPSPVVIPAKSINQNKWEGEDEEEDVKDSWEDDEEEEEKKDEEKLDLKPTKAKPKKTLAEKIAEKELLRHEELAAKQRDRDQLSDEDKLAEKLRLRKYQEEADLMAAKETFGITDKDKIMGGIDGMNPTNKSELNEFQEALNKKICQFKNLDDFPSFIEELVRGVCVNLTSNDLQRIKKTIDNIYIEKQKIEKEKSKKGAGGKGKGKAKLRMEGDNASIQEYGYGDTYEYEDFM